MTSRLDGQTEAMSHRGTDAAGTLAVLVDRVNRVERVGVLSVEALRTPDELRSALTAAYVDAVGKRLDASERDPAERQPVARPVARAAVIPRPALGPDSYRRHRIRQVVHETPRPHMGSHLVAGSSSNGCVTVTVGASPKGRVEVEPGWLRQASRAHLATALNEAYQAAYRESDQR